MAKQQLAQGIRNFLVKRHEQGLPPASANEITTHLGEKRPTVNRYLASLAVGGTIQKLGNGPATRYRISSPVHQALSVTASAVATAKAAGAVGPDWSAHALELRAHLQAPIATRQPVTYRRQFMDDYVPNQSYLLPIELATILWDAGRVQGQQPASTYARKVLEQLLIDLSWHSSRLEGNRKSLLDTKALFAKGRTPGDDLEASMLLNHKDAIEFMVDAAPEYGMTVPVVRNIQSLLMQGLLENPDSLGAIRQTVVNITDSVYVPTQVPTLLEEMLGIVVEKARLIKNPVEAAFFMWVNIAYLQPFEDGNKRTSRLCANLPLMLFNCAPLSFLDVDQQDYAIAVTGVYERLDMSLATELFAWTYRRSIDKYRVILESMGGPDPFRAKLREQLGDAVRNVVSENKTAQKASDELTLDAEDKEAFLEMLRKELSSLETYNCARYRLSMRRTEEWIAKGRHS
jgi:Fic family protein